MVISGVPLGEDGRGSGYKPPGYRTPTLAARIWALGLEPSRGDRDRGSYLAFLLFVLPLKNRRLELSGALSNPRLGVELFRLTGVHKRLVQRAAIERRTPGSAPERPAPVLETITRVLESERRPMRTREIHSAAESLLGRTLLPKSVKGTLASYAGGPKRRFRRVCRGEYELSVRRPSG